MVSLVDVAMRIIANATIVEKSLSDHGHQFPSFDKDAAESFPDLSKELAVQDARLSLIDDSKVLHDLLLGPADLINRLCQSVRIPSTKNEKHVNNKYLLSSLLRSQLKV